MRWNNAKKETDNSCVDVKRQLREQFVGEVEGNLCFDLFCGTGTFTREVYLSRFLQIICVDKKVESLQQLPDNPRIVAYQGDNRELGWRLRCQWGFPDFIDLDAYSNPDGALLPLLKVPGNKARFALTATDGTFLQRQGFNRTPEYWPYGGAHWAPMCLRFENYPTLIYRHLQQWLGEAGYRIADFVLHRPVGRVICYYGLVAEKK